jgi:hypothetical protein
MSNELYKSFSGNAHSSCQEGKIMMYIRVRKLLTSSGVADCGVELIPSSAYRITAQSRHVVSRSGPHTRLDTFVRSLVGTRSKRQGYRGRIPHPCPLPLRRPKQTRNGKIRPHNQEKQDGRYYLPSNKRTTHSIIGHR